MNIARINLEFYMEDEDMLEELVEDGKHNGRYLQIEPIVNRDGIFKRGNECWFEIRGLAFTYDLAMFKYKFSLLDAPTLSSQQMNALHEIVKAKLASKQQKKLYNTVCYNAEDLYRRLEMYKANKKFGLL
jgi:hypothetical protein